ncbi:MAG: hypothetical protein AAB553_05765 [Patescibacteria group bacterium]|mgnify:CR=1 FL=1
MVTQELLENVAERYRQGQNKSQIKEALMAEGWEDIDIDQAVLHWQREGLHQIPFVAKLIDSITDLNERTSKLPPHMVLMSLGFCVLLLLLVVGVLYIVLDPLSVRAGQRDRQREVALGEIQQAIEKYYTTKKGYPKALSMLAPSYIATIPVDPKTGGQYKYLLDPSGRRYELCVVFETKALQCISSSADTTIPVILPSTNP